MVNQFKFGDFVRLKHKKDAAKIAIINQVGSAPDFYHVTPKLGGYGWHTGDELELIDTNTVEKN